MFLCVKIVSNKVVSHSLGPISRCESDRWGRSLLCENLADTNPSPCKMPIFNLLLLICFNR